MPQAPSPPQKAIAPEVTGLARDVGLEVASPRPTRCVVPERVEAVRTGPGRRRREQVPWTHDVGRVEQALPQAPQWVVVAPGVDLAAVGRLAVAVAVAPRRTRSRSGRRCRRSAVAWAPDRAALAAGAAVVRVGLAVDLAAVGWRWRCSRGSRCRRYRPQPLAGAGRRGVGRRGAAVAAGGCSRRSCPGAPRSRRCGSVVAVRETPGHRRSPQLAGAAGRRRARLRGAGVATGAAVARVRSRCAPRSRRWGPRCSRPTRPRRPRRTARWCSSPTWWGPAGQTLPQAPQLSGSPAMSVSHPSAAETSQSAKPSAQR